MSCLAILAVTAAMIIDGDAARLVGSNGRLTGEGNAPSILQRVGIFQAVAAFPAAFRHSLAAGCA